MAVGVVATVTAVLIWPALAGAGSSSGDRSRLTGAAVGTFASRLAVDSLLGPGPLAGPPETGDRGAETIAVAALHLPIVDPPTTTTTTAAATTTTTTTTTTQPTGAVPDPTAAGLPAVPGAAAWARLRACESGDDYQRNTGNGYYGAYQFAQSTWTALGEPGRPDLAPPAVQDQAAQKLWDLRGWEPWPACSRKLGL